MDESQNHSNIVQKGVPDCVPLAKSCVGYDMYINHTGKIKQKQ